MLKNKVRIALDSDAGTGGTNTSKAILRKCVSIGKEVKY
jgi:hypothetical protein